ncbi:hypothetical protein LVJ94_33355 [Pendulispora rubella]|uniref:Uncharacterized protein n=1 Tax=Pendulispora rubella TaxID=2741070 RepID=A0ABZ2KSY7_9BACT
MKHLLRVLNGLAVVAASILAQGPAAAADAPDGTARAVVETNEAVFFELKDAAHANIVYFIPRTETTVTPFSPDPDDDHWTAAVRFKTVTNRDLPSLYPDWRGKTLRPFIVRPASECVLHVSSPVRSVEQYSFAKDRDISAADTVPICDFVFRIPLADPSAVVASLKQQATAGTLIDKDVKVVLAAQGQSIPWKPLYQDLLARRSIPGERLEKDDALLSLGIAVRASAPWVSYAALPPSDKTAFRVQAFSALFSGGTGGYVLVSQEPAGGFNGGAGTVKTYVL